MALSRIESEQRSILSVTVGTSDIQEMDLQCLSNLEDYSPSCRCLRRAPTRAI